MTCYNEIILRMTLNPKELRVLDFMSHTNFDHTLTQIANKCDVSRTLLRTLVKKDVLLETRNDGKSKYFELYSLSAYTKKHSK